jgi:hypothetical protein
MRGSRAFFAGLTIITGLTAPGTAAAENVLRWASVGGALTADPMPTTITRPSPSSVRSTSI